MTKQPRLVLIRSLVTVGIVGVLMLVTIAAFGCQVHFHVGEDHTWYAGKDIAEKAKRAYELHAASQPTSKPSERPSTED